MLFNLFSSQPAASDPACETFDPSRTASECDALNTALHSLLETLPQSHSGRENIKLLCHAILGATSHLCFVWVGFCEGNHDRVAPYAAAGACAEECDDWRLPSACFDSSGPYTQSFRAQSFRAGSESRAELLFSPWAAAPHRGSARCALAIPLRSEKRGLRGLIVFYADSPDYFAHVGVQLFQAFCHMAEIIWKQSNLMHMLTQRSQQDQLTGLMNRRQTVHVLEQGIAESERSGNPLSILLLRVEGFSKLNDLYGWFASDSILAVLARETMAQMRSQDQGGRWTGTEFLYVLPQTGDDEAESIAQRLREYFLVNPLNIKTWSIRLELSIGVAAYSRHIIGLDDLILHANQNMRSGSDELPSSVI